VQTRALAESERDTYAAMWSVPDYAKTSPGEQLVPAFLEMSGAIPQGDPHWCERFPMGHIYRSLVRASRQQTVLDAGCGSGKGGVALAQAGFRVALCDLTGDGLVDEAKALPFHHACLWQPIRAQVAWPERQFDWVYCCDVLEHVPPTFAMLVISRLLEVARKGLFLSIALQGDNFGVWVNRPLHVTVQSFVQWRDQLHEIGRVKEARDMLMNGVYLVEPR
jgi:SAM-dependent methyltransferase